MSQYTGENLRAVITQEKFDLLKWTVVVYDIYDGDESVVWTQGLAGMTDDQAARHVRQLLDQRIEELARVRSVIEVRPTRWSFGHTKETK